MLGVGVIRFSDRNETGEALGVLRNRGGSDGFPDEGAALLMKGFEVFTRPHESCGIEHDDQRTRHMKKGGHDRVKIPGNTQCSKNKHI